jgi:NitT/TauT family transport system ATP-binding protein
MVKVEGISKTYGNLTVLDQLSLAFPTGKITAILGPSGCGKTTLLNILAGLTKADQGTVVTEENTSYLFQEPRLLPWLNTWQNVALVLQDKMPPAKVAEQVALNLAATGLTGFENYYPSQLSGGMRQRVAMARAFSYESSLLLMDEPFKSVDIKTRFQLIRDFLILWRRQPRTVITVTHEPREAVWLGDKIVILSTKPARIEKEFEIKTPQEGRTEDRGLLDLEKEIFNFLLK